MKLLELFIRLHRQKPSLAFLLIYRINTMTTDQLYTSYQQKMQRIADIRFATAVLQWDQETQMPPQGATFRGQQISTLTELSHDLFSQDEVGRLLQELLGKNDLNNE